jgi:hypothetical protein
MGKSDFPTQNYVISELLVVPEIVIAVIRK